MTIAKTADVAAREAIDAARRRDEELAASLNGKSDKEIADLMRDNVADLNRLAEQIRLMGITVTYESVSCWHVGLPAGDILEVKVLRAL